jgi:hypothetical protein
VSESDTAVELPTVGDPASKAELLGELRSLHARSTEFWARFGADEFYAPLGDAWSPADNVRHLIKSNRPVAMGLELPKIALVLRGGLGLRRSRSYREVRETYRAALARGVTAGRFAPRPEPAPADADGARRTLMERRDQVAADLHAAIEAWGERALDRCRMPHPALGLLTVREMLFFTLYHNLHHVLNVARRLGWDGGHSAGG